MCASRLNTDTKNCGKVQSLNVYDMVVVGIATVLCSQNIAPGFQIELYVEPHILPLFKLNFI